MIPALAIPVIAKDRLDILPAIEDPHELGPIILQSIEHNLRSSRQRTQTDPDFVARPAREGKVVMTATTFAISRRIRSAVPDPATSV